MRYRIALLAALALLAGCTAPDHARDLLQRQGYTNIETHGYDWFACGEEDVFQTKFSATSPAGGRITGTVCKGWLKSATIRFD